MTSLLMSSYLATYCRYVQNAAIYSQALRTEQNRRENRQTKGLDMAMSLLDYTASFQSPMMNGIARKWMQESVFARRLSFIPVDGFSYRYPEEVSAGGIAFRALNENYADLAAGVVNPRSEVLGIFGRLVKTDNQFLSKNGDLARANEISRAQRAAALFYDYNVLHGDGATNPKAITGLYSRLQAAQLITNSDNGADLSLAKMDALLDSVYGPNESKVLLMNKNARRQLKWQIQDLAGGAQVADIGGSLKS
jgi:hypothetical protein